jgi:hypothetical protein
LVLNGEYEFEAYSGTTFLKTYYITATSNAIYIMIYFGQTSPDYNASGYTVTFTPNQTGLTKINVGTQIFTQTAKNFGQKNTIYVSSILVNGITISSLPSYTGTDANKMFSHTINWVDINKGTLTSRLTVTQGGITHIFQQNYVINDSFGTNFDILNGLRVGLKTDLGCSADGDCFPLMALAILISIGLVIYASTLLGAFNGQAAGLVFVISMILFTYLTWVPVILTAAITLIMLAFLINERRQ